MYEYTLLIICLLFVLFYTNKTRSLTSQKGGYAGLILAIVFLTTLLAGGGGAFYYYVMQDKTCTALTADEWKEMGISVETLGSDNVTVESLGTPSITSGWFSAEDEEIEVACKDGTFRVSGVTQCSPITYAQPDKISCTGPDDTVLVDSTSCLPTYVANMTTNTCDAAEDSSDDNSSDENSSDENSSGGIDTSPCTDTDIICQNNGNPVRNSEGNCVCDCTDDYSGDDCTAPRQCRQSDLDYQCQNNSSVSGDYPDCSCDCDDSAYQGESCNSVINGAGSIVSTNEIADPSTCENTITCLHGTITGVWASDESNSCNCTSPCDEGYEGQNCDELVKCSDAPSSAGIPVCEGNFLIDPNATYDDETGWSSCVCNTCATGTTLDTVSGQDYCRVLECNRDTCNNHGSQTGNQVEGCGPCVCDEGYTGENCEYISYNHNDDGTCKYNYVSSEGGDCDECALGYEMDDSQRCVWNEWVELPGVLLNAGITPNAGSAPTGADMTTKYDAGPVWYSRPDKPYGPAKCRGALGDAGAAQEFRGGFPASKQTAESHCTPELAKIGNLRDNGQYSFEDAKKLCKNLTPEEDDPQEGALGWFSGGRWKDNYGWRGETGMTPSDGPYAHPSQPSDHKNKGFERYNSISMGGGCSGITCTARDSDTPDNCSIIWNPNLLIQPTDSDLNYILWGPGKRSVKGHLVPPQRLDINDIVEEVIVGNTKRLQPKHDGGWRGNTSYLSDSETEETRAIWREAEKNASAETDGDLETCIYPDENGEGPDKLRNTWCDRFPDASISQTDSQNYTTYIFNPDPCTYRVCYGENVISWAEHDPVVHQDSGPPPLNVMNRDLYDDAQPGTGTAMPRSWSTGYYAPVNPDVRTDPDSVTCTQANIPGWTRRWHGNWWSADDLPVGNLDIYAETGGKISWSVYDQFGRNGKGSEFRNYVDDTCPAI